MPLAIVNLLKNPLTAEFSGTRYLKAGSEVFALIMVCSWILTYFYNPSVIEDNALKRRLGYNNLCVGFDTAPALYIAIFLWPLTTYFNIRFAWLEVVTEYSLEEKHTSPTGKLMTVVASGLFVLSCLCQTLLFVLPPAEGSAVYKHTAIFLQYIIVRVIVIATQFFKNKFDGNSEEQDAITTGQWYWFYLFMLSSLLIPIFGTLDFVYYDFYKPADVEGPFIPWYILQAADLLWFACLATTVKFVPGNHDYRIKQMAKVAQQEIAKELS